MIFWPGRTPRSRWRAIGVKIGIITEKGRRLYGDIVTTVSPAIIHERARSKQRYPIFIIPIHFN
jgi:hypothetical protein